MQSQRDGLAGWLLIQVMNDSWEVRILVRRQYAPAALWPRLRHLMRAGFKDVEGEVEGRVSLSDFRGVESSCSSSSIAYGG